MVGAVDEVETIWIELQDRFGPAPEPALWLYHLTKIKVYAAYNGFSIVKQEKMSLLIEKRKGKETTLYKVLSPRYKTPAELETKVLAILQSKLAPST